MELRQLRYFVAVADTLNFSRASESLYVSQSALSKQIAELEQELGAVLFVRDKRTVELSPAGRMLLSEAKAILLRSEKLGPRLVQRDLQTNQEQHIHIGIEQRADQSPLIHRVLAESIYLQRKRKPGLQAVFWTQDYLKMKKDLIGGTLDLGIFLHPEKEVDQNMESCLLYEDEMVLVYRGDEEYEESDAGILQALEERGLVLIEKEFRGMSQIVGILDAIGSAPDIHFRKSGTELTLSLVSGDGSAIIPKSQLKSLDNPQLKVLHFNCSQAKIYLLAVWHKDKENLLAEEIAKETAENMKRLFEI